MSAPALLGAAGGQQQPLAELIGEAVREVAAGPAKTIVVAARPGAGKSRGVETLLQASRFGTPVAVVPPTVAETRRFEQARTRRHVPRWSLDDGQVPPPGSAPDGLCPRLEEATEVGEHRQSVASKLCVSCPNYVVTQWQEVRRVGEVGKATALEESWAATHPRQPSLAVLATQIAPCTYIPALKADLAAWQLTLTPGAISDQTLTYRVSEDDRLWRTILADDVTAELTETVMVTPSDVSGWQTVAAGVDPFQGRLTRAYA